MRLGELTYLTDQIVTFGFSSLELRNKAQIHNKRFKLQEGQPTRCIFTMRCFL